jgi:hypothetical protein
MPYAIRLPDGTLVENIPDGMSPEAAKAKIIQSMPQYGSKERTYGEAFSDIGAAGLGGIGSLVQLPGQLYGLATGDFSKTGALGAGQDLEEYAKGLKSKGLLAREAARDVAVQNAEKQGQLQAFKTAIGQTISDPALMSTFLAEQLPQIIPAALTGGATAAATSGNVLAKAAARQISKEAAEKVAKREAIRAGTTAAVGTGAVQQGADIGAGTYDEIVKELVDKGATPEQAGQAAINLARASGVSGAALSLIANRYLPGGQALERVLAGGSTGKGLLMGATTGAAKELPSEILEETGGRFVQNVALREVKPEQSLTQGLGATAGQAALGAVGLGGITGAIGGRGGAAPEAPVDQQQQPPAVTPAPTAPPEPEVERSLEELLAAGKKPPVEYKAPKDAVITAPKGSLDELEQIIAAQQQKYDTRKQEIERKQGMNQNPKGQITANEQLAAELTSMREALAKRIADGETYVTKSDQGTGGAGPEVSVPAGAVTPPAEGAGAPERSGVDSTGQNVGAPDTGAAGQQAPVTLSTEAQVAKDLLDAIDKGGVPLNPSKINEIARNLGLEVNKAAKPEETIARLREAVTRASQPTGETVGTQTTQTQQAEAQGQKPPPAPTVAPAAPPPPPTPTAAPAVKTAAQQDEDLLNGLLGDDGLPSTGSARRTNAQIAKDNQIEALGKKYGLAQRDGESQQDFGKRLRSAVAFEKERESTTLSTMSEQSIAAQDIKEEQGYFPPKEQRELYEETRQEYNERVDEKIKDGEATEDDKLPAYKELDNNDRLVYFRDNISQNNQIEHDKAAKALAEHLSDKRSESRAAPDSQKTEAMDQIRAQKSYERERGGFGSKTGLAYSFPGWNSLSDESRKLFSSINKTDTVLEQDMAFRAVKKQVQKEKLEESSKEEVEGAERRALQEMLAAVERARASQPSGKGSILPDDIVKALYEGDIKTVLDYLNQKGNGLALKEKSDYFLTALKKVAGRVDKDGDYIEPKYRPIFKKKKVPIRDSIAMGVFRALAGTLGNIDNFKVNVVYDENMVYDQLARYDAKTNTIYVGPNGLDEATILHELLHAATVKIIHQYFTDPTKLSARARESVKRLIDIASAAKKVLGNKYPNAFDNLYEFVAYSQTDMDFQFDLAGIQVTSLASATAKTQDQSLELQEEREISPTGYDTFMDTLFGYYTGTLAYMYKLFTPGSKAERVLIPTETSRLTRRTQPLTKKELADREIKQKKLVPNSDENIDEFNARIDERIQELNTKLEDLKVSDEERVLGAIQRYEQEIKDLEDSKVKTLSKESEEALAPETLFDDPEKEMKAADIPPFEGEMVVQRGVANLKRAILREPGYKGNLLLEAAEMVQAILAAPEGGIERLAGLEGIRTELPAGKKGAAGKPTTQKAPKTTTQRSPDEIIAEQKLPNEKSTSKVRDFITSTAGARRLATIFANSRYPIKVWEDALQRAKKTIDAGPKLNNIYTQITLSAARAKDLYLTMVNTPATELQKAIGEYAKAAKVDSDLALKQLHTYFMALHEPERRAIKFLRNVPLKNSNVQYNGRTINPANFRKDVLDAVESGKLTKKEIKRLRTELDGVVAQFAEASGESPGGYKTIDMNGSDYNVIGNLSPAEAKTIRDKFDGNKKADAVITAMKAMNDVTAELNKKANYWSKPVQSVVDFYGWDHYIPFKGKEVSSGQDGMLDFDILKTDKRFGEKLQDFQSEFEGRESWSDNSLTQIMSDATRAAMRAGRKDLTLAIKNAIDQKLLMGSINEVKGLNGNPVEFADRNKIDLGELSGKTTIFHYNENGSIDVLQVYSEAERNAIRRAYQQTNPLIDMLNTVTSTVGQFHTRYNVAFAPMNYFRDMLTNAFTIGTDMDAATAAQYIGAVTSQVVNGGMYKTWKIASLYNSGKMAELNAFVAKDKSGFSQDVMEYIKEGGMVSYLQGLSAKGTFMSLQKDLNSSKPKKALAAMNGFFDVYADMFELSSRTAAYRITRNRMLREDKLSDEAAKTRAAAYVKNLANFEQVGEWGRGAGAIFMFFRPAATGAVRAIETLGPMIRSTDDAILDLPPEVRKDEKAVAEFRKNHEKQRKAAQAMTLSLAGFGVGMYLLSMALSDDDELGRNRTKTDDINRWARYARFHIPGMDNPIQIPWGFGLGAFAASGAQIAAIATGQASIKEGFSNTLSVMMDSFLPLPVSRINMFDNFPAWLMDSALPSAARPLFEWQMNIDALGREIYNNRQTRVGDAYTGGDNIPELYKSAARTLADVTNGAIDWSPNTLYFFANNYADGPMRLAQTGMNLSLLVTGEKNFNPKTDTVLFDSFFGSVSNFDAKQFSNIEKQIKDKERKLKMFESNPEQYAKYVEANPMDEYLVKMYNEGVNGRLKEYREEANAIRKMPDLSPKDRSDALKNIVQMQNFEKRHMIDAFDAFDIKP